MRHSQGGLLDALSRPDAILDIPEKGQLLEILLRVAPGNDISSLHYRISKGLGGADQSAPIKVCHFFGCPVSPSVNALGESVVSVPTPCSGGRVQVDSQTNAL